MDLVCDLARPLVGILLACVIGLGFVLGLWNLKFDLKDGRLDGQHCSDCPLCAGAEPRG